MWRERISRKAINPKPVATAARETASQKRGAFWASLSKGPATDRVLTMRAAVEAIERLFRCSAVLRLYAGGPAGFY